MTSAHRLQGQHPLLLFAVTFTICLETEFDFIFYVWYRSEEISPQEVPFEWCVATISRHSRDESYNNVVATHAPLTGDRHRQCRCRPRTNGRERSISPQVLNKAWRPPPQGRQWSIHCLRDKIPTVTAMRWIGGEETTPPPIYTEAPSL